jgi:hypothetical protein
VYGGWPGGPIIGAGADGPGWNVVAQSVPGCGWPGWPIGWVGGCAYCPAPGTGPVGTPADGGG